MSVSFSTHVYLFCYHFLCTLFCFIYSVWIISNSSIYLCSVLRNNANKFLWTLGTCTYIVLHCNLEVYQISLYLRYCRNKCLLLVWITDCRLTTLQISNLESDFVLWYCKRIVQKSESSKVRSNCQKTDFSLSFQLFTFI